MKRNQKDRTFLFLAKDKPFSKDAAELIKLHFNKVEVVIGNTNDPFPNHLFEKKYDYIISYLSPWIVPKQILTNTKIAAINFHPGPPEYPGIGCTNFAIYYDEKEYGITVHHMVEKVDSGEIIIAERFPVFSNDSVFLLTQRCYAYIYFAFLRIFPLILSNKSLPKSTEHWKRKPFTRKELNELHIITQDMSTDEIRRRIKATTYPGMPSAYMEIRGVSFCPTISLDKK